MRWTPSHSIKQGLSETVDWYRANVDWVKRVKSGSYADYYEKNYGSREAQASPEQLGSALS